MKRVAQLAVIAAWSVIVFAGGYLFRQHELLRSPFVAQEPLELTGGQEAGLLPKGAVLYDYGGRFEPPMFVVFVGTKELASLRQSQPQRWQEIGPLMAWRK